MSGHCRDHTLANVSSYTISNSGPDCTKREIWSEDNIPEAAWQAVCNRRENRAKAKRSKNRKDTP